MGFHDDWGRREDRCIPTQWESHSLKNDDLATAGVCLDEREGGHVRLSARVREADLVHGLETLAEEFGQSALILVDTAEGKASIDGIMDSALDHWM